MKQNQINVFKINTLCLFHAEINSIKNMFV